MIVRLQLLASKKKSYLLTKHLLSTVFFLPTSSPLSSFSFSLIQQFQMEPAPSPTTQNAIVTSPYLRSLFVCHPHLTLPHKS